MKMRNQTMTIPMPAMKRKEKKNRSLMTEIQMVLQVLWMFPFPHTPIFLMHMSPALLIILAQQAAACFRVVYISMVCLTDARK